MTLKQKTLALLYYPLRMIISQKTGMGKTILKAEEHAAITPFYNLSATANNGTVQPFNEYNGRFILIVNLASNCGFTNQYAELESLYNTYKQKLVVLGFPSNNFGGQEPGSDKEIEEFCQINFSISFPVFKKTDVIGTAQHQVYKWLTSISQNGWNDQQPSWNFCKYLISPHGNLISYFSAAVSPLSKDITNILI